MPGAHGENWTRCASVGEQGPKSVQLRLGKARSERFQRFFAAALESLGAGSIAEEALAIAVYAALAHPQPGEILDALSPTVTHSGDSDSTGSICVGILGALHGDSALPPELIFEAEGRGTILTLADDFIYEFTAGSRLHGDYGPVSRWTDRHSRR